MLQFATAKPQEAESLTAVSVRAFHSDIQAGALIPKGPPGYDSAEFHVEMMETATSFYTITYEGSIVGAFWFHCHGQQRAHLYRIFIDPDYHRLGFGKQAFAFLFKTYPWIKTWSLKTPCWNTRTPKFYAGLGFSVSKEEGNFRYFEKVI